MLFIRLFGYDGLAPHGTCLLWESNLFWTHAASDTAIALAYYLISAAIIIYIARRTDLLFKSAGVLFSAFILACATCHALDVWTLWYPDYGVQAVVKIVTAVVSLITAVALWPMLPRALALPSVGQLAAANQALNAEIAERWQIERSLRQAEEQLRGSQDELERRVEERTRELALRTKELEASNQELAQFAYVASHDLRQPLRMVSSFLSLLERRLSQQQLDAESAEYLDFARDGAQRMDRLIVDLLDYARVGQSTVPSAEVALAAVIDAVIRTVQATLAEAGGTITIDSELPMVWGDADELARLFQNLLSNSIKYRDTSRPLVVTIGCKREAGHWLMWVADNGIGIAPEYHQRVFGVFQRLHASDQYEGTGIGLAVCRKIVEARGGRIWIESEAGQGTKFCIAWPIPG